MSTCISQCARRCIHSAMQTRRCSVVLTVDANGTLVAAQQSSHPLVVTSSTGTVVSRPTTQDVFIEVPTNTPRCSYNTACANIGLTLIDMVATNPHPTDYQTLRLSFSRNFETRDTSLSQSGTSAEITGLSMQLWETSTLQPTGIPIQISKNWHVGSTAAYWAGFNGYAAPTYRLT